SSIFLDLDPLRWKQVNHNPVALLADFPLAKLEGRATELALHSRINYAYRRLREYLEADRTWGARHAGVLRPRPVAYFSAEFGLHESLPIYSGGLGVLAGDHIKSASDLGIPLVGGLRALRAMGITPSVLHLNEGHSAFAVLEAVRLRVEEEGVSFHNAVSRVSREVVFTTHTPVPAGHDRFDAALLEEHLGLIREELGLSQES